MIDKNNDGKIDASEYSDYRRTHDENYYSSSGADVGFFIMVVVVIAIAILWMFSPLLPYVIDVLKFIRIYLV